MHVNFSGIWNANLPKSRFLGPPPKAIAIRIVQSDSELKEEVIVTKSDGGKDRAVLHCWTSGEPDKTLLNGKPIRGSARWEGEELLIESWTQLGDRGMYFCDCWSLSANGKALIMEHRSDDLAGQLTFLDRVE